MQARFAGAARFATVIRAVGFDMGGVLYTAVPTRERYLAFAAEAKALLAARGIAIPETTEAFEQRLARADKRRKAENERTLRELPPLEAWRDYYLAGLSFSETAIFPIAEELCLRWNELRNYEAPREGALSCMEGLYRQGVRIAVISNTLSYTHVPKLLQQYGLARYVQYMLLSSVCGLRKPDPAIFELCRASMGLPREEMAYVGDTISRDLIGARRAQWGLAIRIRNPLAKENERARETALEEAGETPDLTVDALCEIPALIGAYNQQHP